MRQNRDHYLPRIWLGCAFFTVLTFAAALSFAQKTTVKEIGGGQKLEMDYDAAGQVTEQRTIGADGKLKQKVEYQRRPGYFVADQTNTSYFPDGKISKIVQNTYDANANFLGEFVQVLNESGKQIGGHKLTHDPMTNVYTCREWNSASQNYKLIECPAGEESGGGPEKVTTFTYDEVIQHLTAARKAPREEEKTTLVKPHRVAANPELALVVPAVVYPGERVSGRVVTNPLEYESMAGVTVTRVGAPLASSDEASMLAGWTVELPGESQQRADGPIVFTVPRNGAGLDFTFHPVGNSAQSVSKTVNFPKSTAKQQKPAKGFEAAALCVKGQLCVVRGQFSGDSSKTFSTFEDRPATVVAETPDTAYIRIPDQTEPGPRPLFISEGSEVIALPVAIAEFSLFNGEKELKSGDKLVTFPVLEGPGDVAETAWRTENFPATNLEEARKLIPGFKLPKENREEREKREAQEKRESKDKREEEEKKGGLILLVVKNMTPDQISLQGFKDQMAVFHLNDESFSRGEFKYDLLIQALKPGHFDIRGYAIPFLAPVRGQEFSGKTPSTRK